MYNLSQNQEQIVNQLLNSLVAYINEFDNNKEFQKNTTESGGVTPHVAKELHDNIKRAFKISGKDYGSDMCCFSFSKPNKVNIEKCLNAMSNKTINNPEEAIGLLMIKFKLSKEDAERYYHGYCGDREFSKKRNFSERLNKCFSETYTQVFDFSIEGKLLPESFEQEVIDAGYKVEDTSSTAGRGGLDSIAIEVEREPTDKLNEVVNFIANKFNVDPSKVEYSKWD